MTLTVIQGGGAGSNGIKSMIQSVAAQFGVPSQYALDIAQVESGLNPNAIGDNGTSFGLYQLHTPGGQGAGYSQSTLLNPYMNAEIAMPYIAQGYHEAQAQGLTGYSALAYTADHSGHPDSTGYMPSSYGQSLYNAYTGNGGTGPMYGPASPFGVSSGMVQGTNSFIQDVANIMKVKSYSLGESPTQYISHNAQAIGLRMLLFLIGLILVIFALVMVTNNVKGEIAKAVV